jgi:short-subunit dehydrogenase
VFVTGASKGYGRALAVEMARAVKASPLALVLMARGEAGLSATQALVLEVGVAAHTQRAHAASNSA